MEGTKVKGLWRQMTLLRGGSREENPHSVTVKGLGKTVEVEETNVVRRKGLIRTEETCGRRFQVS